LNGSLLYAQLLHLLSVQLVFLTEDEVLMG